MPVKDLFKDKYETFTKSERKIADFIVSDPDRFVNMTLNEISATVGVGEATIVRFLKKCGYRLLLELRYDIIRKMDAPGHELADVDGMPHIAAELEKQVQATAKAIDKEQVMKVAVLLKKAVHVYYFGIGQSGLAAEIGAYRCARRGRQAQAGADAHMQIITAGGCGTKDLVFAFSYSGTSPEVIKAVKIARQRGATTVGISANDDGEVGLCGLCDYFFLCTGEGPKRKMTGSGLDSLVTMAMISEVIMEQYEKNDYERINDYAGKMTLTIAEGREQ